MLLIVSFYIVCKLFVPLFFSSSVMFCGCWCCCFCLSVVIKFLVIYFSVLINYVSIFYMITIKHKAHSITNVSLYNKLLLCAVIPYSPLTFKFLFYIDIFHILLFKQPVNFLILPFLLIQDFGGFKIYLFECVLVTL